MTPKPTPTERLFRALAALGDMYDDGPMLAATQPDVLIMLAVAELIGSRDLVAAPVNFPPLELGSPVAVHILIPKG